MVIVGLLVIRKQWTQPTYSIIIPNTQTEETNMATLDIRVMSELTVDEILFYKISEANALSCIKNTQTEIASL